MIMRQSQRSVVPQRPTFQQLGASRYLLSRAGVHHSWPRMVITHSSAAGRSASQLSPKDALLLQQIMNYKYIADTPEGQLVISPLRVEWLQRTGDLLADTFVDAKGIQPYRRYVRRNIGKYLDQHINMPPEAVLMTAVLHSQVPVGTDAQLALDTSPGPSTSTDAGSSSSSGGSSSSGSSSGAAAASFEAMHPLNKALVQLLGWLIIPNEPTRRNDTTASASHQSDTSAGTVDSSVRNSFQTSTAGNDVDSNATDSGDNSSSNNKGSSSNASSSPSVGSLVHSALQQISNSIGLQQLSQQGRPSQMRRVEQLLGVVEVSFRETTRAQSLTLNPPQKCAYLCNMAVSQDWRRRGVASHLLTAVEDMCLLAGEEDLYLHLRFKDAAAAGVLYDKAGFTQSERDCWLLLLIGQEPRYLMKKELDPHRSLSGSVQLPVGLQQPAGAAEPQGQSAGDPRVGGQPAPAPAASPAA